MMLDDVDSQSICGGEGDWIAIDLSSCGRGREQRAHKKSV
jgi:hypothetical protein